MVHTAKVIGFDNLVPEKVLRLLSTSVKQKYIDTIIPIHSYNIEQSLLQSPNRIFLTNKGQDSETTTICEPTKQDLLIYALPRSLSEYKACYGEVNEIRNILVKNKEEEDTIIVLYSSELDSFIGWKDSNDILASFGRSEKSLIESLRCSESIKIFAEWDFKYSNLLSNLSLNKKVVLVVGSGGREHAMALSLAKSLHVSKVLVCPGNGGTMLSTSNKISNAPDLNSMDAIVKYCCVGENNVDLVAVGPEQFLVEGIVNEMQVKCPQVKVFGPTKEAAILEASKAFTKDFLQECSIPTATYQNFTDVAAAKAYVAPLPYRVVIKASGLAAGKGVLLPTSLPETLEAIDAIMSDKAFGTAGDTCVIEECLEGEEASCIAFCDGKTAKLLPPAQDHKRALEGDEGLNTGGMGAYAPAPIVTPDMQRQIEDICNITVQKMAERGMPFVGILYAGIMLTKKGPQVLEFNCRFGDPETQVLLPLLESDLYEVMSACCNGTLSSVDLAIKPNTFAATVVCAAKGYPEAYPKGMKIVGLDQPPSKDVFVYHAGTKQDSDGSIRCSGGRVLSVTGVGSSLTTALDNSYKAIDKIDFRKETDDASYMHYRKDIGYKAIYPKRKLRIGVLGSTRGTAMLPIIQACADNSINAEIVCILSNKPSALILQKGNDMPNCHTQFVSAKGLTRSEYDAEVSSILSNCGVDLVVLIGYMRIVSDEFCSYWEGRCMNVHPSLLPKFAGGMDLQVHQAVIDAKETTTGCTVHYVTEVVDSGPIVVQKSVLVEQTDTAETLKVKVQPLEGPAFIEAISVFILNQSSPNQLTYAAAGVDIQVGNAFVDNIKPIVSKTKRPGCDAEIGGFGGLFDLKAAGFDSDETILVGATDGVGTKLRIAQIMNKHDTIGIDLVAMCVNDILVTGGEPLFFLDYFSTSKLKVSETTEVVRGIAIGCQQSKCGLIGGETAEMPGIYKKDEYDLAGFALGAVRRNDILPQHIQAGDVLLGLSSSGVHSNGFSLVRKIVEVDDSLSYLDPCPWNNDISLGECLLTPTKIYIQLLLPLVQKKLIKGLSHITGGGLLENLPRVLPSNLNAQVNFHPPLPDVFSWIKQKANLEDNEMLRTFNCGIGMVIIVSKDDVELVKSAIAEAADATDHVYELGYLTSKVTDEDDRVVMKHSLN